MDRRQKKTREAIFNAFCELLSKKRYEQITVGEIIERADVGRATFYAHFETKDFLLKELCAECGLEKFHTEMLKLSRIWFSGEEGDSLADELEDYILKAGVYGKTENKVAVEQSKDSSKLAYLMRRIFIPYDDLKYYYPILQKHKWLLPAMEVRRWFRLVFCGGFGRSVKELKTGISMSDEKSGRIVSLMKEVGL